MKTGRNELRLLFQEIGNPYKQLNIVFLLISVIPILSFSYILCEALRVGKHFFNSAMPVLFFANCIIILGYIAGYKITKNLLNKIISYAEKAKQADELKSGFAMALAHDLKSPLAVIKANISNLTAGFLGNLTPQQAEVILTCKDVTDRMNSILMNLINTYKIEAKLTELIMSRFDLRKLVEDQKREFEVIASAKHITLTMECSKIPLFFDGDRDLILRAVNNLLNNAIKYTPQNGKVTVKALATDGFARIEILNTGALIPENRLEKIFDKFERLDQSVEGEGLGLAIAKDIVELHKGKIWASSDPGKPNCFTILLTLTAE